jgi:arylsulfatase A-like enzyme
MARLSVLVAALGLVAGANAGAVERPNLVVIHTDEHNFRTLGCYRGLLPADQAFIWGEGVAVETPNLDWLARHGAICDRFYATSPLCTPSRASLVSGRYPQNAGTIGNNDLLRQDVVTFAEALRRRGYATGYAGKWHLNGEPWPGWAPGRKFGFEDNRYMFNRGHWKTLAETAEGPRVATVDDKGAPNYDVAGADATSFTTDFLADRAVAFIEAHKGGPFCYMVSIPDPHGPNTVRPPYDTMFAGLPFRQPLSARSPGKDLPPYATVRPDPFDVPEMARYFGMVKCVDDNVGKILGALRAAGVLGRTFVVFTSDHGDMCGEHGRYDKEIPLEASARIPFLLYAPGVVRPGTVVRQALGTVDFKPTILALLGLDATDPARGGDEGRDASALFRDPDRGRAASWEDMTFVRYGRPARGRVRLGPLGREAAWMGAFSRRYKLVVVDADAEIAGPALFDLEEDPHEMTNLFAAPSQRDTIRRLARELADYARTYRDPLLESPHIRAQLTQAEEGTGPARPSGPRRTRPRAGRP